MLINYRMRPSFLPIGGGLSQAPYRRGIIGKRDRTLAYDSARYNCSYRYQKHLLDYHLKTGHTLSVQNRPTGLAEDVIVLPCCSVRLQGLGLSPRSGVCYCGFALPGSRLAE